MLMYLNRRLHLLGAHETQRGADSTAAGDKETERLRNKRRADVVCMHDVEVHRWVHLWCSVCRSRRTFCVCLEQATR